MESEILFTETQKFRQWWVWLILIGFNGLMLFGIYKQVICGEQFGDQPVGNNALIITAIITTVISLLFYSVRLETRIKNDGVYVRFFPFHNKVKTYPWNSVIKSYVKKYAPIADFGGWGLRIGTAEKGTAYNVSGNDGLQLEFCDHKKVLIGTLKPQELSAALNQVKLNNN